MTNRAQQNESFVVLGYFLPFHPINNPKNKNFKKWKKQPEISSFYSSAP